MGRVIYHDEVVQLQPYTKPRSSYSQKLALHYGCKKIILRLTIMRTVVNIRMTFCN